VKFDFDAAIFDMDGTLLDSMPYWRYTTLEYILGHGYPLRQDYVARMYSEPAGKLLPLYAAEEGLYIDMNEAFRELEMFMNRHYINDVRTKVNAKEFLGFLKTMGKRMCVATATPIRYANNGLERTGINSYFEFVTDQSDTGYTKASSEYFTILAERLGIKPERCMVFEDALYSIESAKAAGMQVCAIEDGAQAKDREAIMRLSDYYIRDFGECIE